MMRARCTSTDPMGIPPSARPLRASSNAASMNSSALNVRNGTPACAQNRMALEIRSQRELAHLRSESRREPDRFFFALGIGGKGPRLETANILRSEPLQVVDVQLLVGQLTQVVEKNHRLECHRSVHLCLATRNVEPVRYEQRTGIVVGGRAAHVMQSRQIPNHARAPRLDADGLE